MRSEKEILAVAARVKIAMLGRLEKIKEYSAALALHAGQAAPDLRPERVGTMRKELESFTANQELDAQIFATLRWVIGITEDIDSENLELLR